MLVDEIYEDKKCPYCNGIIYYKVCCDVCRDSWYQCDSCDDGFWWEGEDIKKEEEDDC